MCRKNTFQTNRGADTLGGLAHQSNRFITGVITHGTYVVLTGYEVKGNGYARTDITRGLETIQIRGLKSNGTESYSKMLEAGVA